MTDLTAEALEQLRRAHRARPPVKPVVVDRWLDEGDAFAVCYCGRMIRLHRGHGDCEDCGYMTPMSRQAVAEDLFAEWTRAARAARLKRDQRARGRALRRTRTRA